MSNPPTPSKDDVADPRSNALSHHMRLLPMALGYTLCSSSLMVVNKAALALFPFPSTLMMLQFFASAIVVRSLSALGYISAEPLELSKVRQFWMVPFFFELAIYANIKLLQSASVETTIVFRTLVPLITSWADWHFMGRELPSQRSAASLLTVVLATLVYATSSSGGIKISTWAWAILYLGVLAFEMVYVKHVLNKLPMSTWTRVYYNNALALLMAPPFLLVGSEYSQRAQIVAVLSQQRPALAVLLSCALGVGISFTGFGLRQLVTATTFTVMGVMNKVLTVLMSIGLFANKASPLGVCALLASIGGGTLYQQAPPRTNRVQSDEEGQALLSSAGGPR